jgi:hypothetical protein
VVKSGRRNAFGDASAVPDLLLGLRVVSSDHQVAYLRVHPGHTASQVKIPDFPAESRRPIDVVSQPEFVAAKARLLAALDS